MANSTIEEIKDRLNIVDVISSYLPVKKAGTNFKVNCPFHKEKTASLMVSPSKQIWHCFGCGEGGDVFGFVMKYENLEFGETLKLLAQRAGVELPKYTPRDVEFDKHKDLLYRAADLTARFYHKILLETHTGAPAKKYLEQRGLKPATIAEWQIGFAPGDFHTLQNFLLKKGFAEKDLLEAGLLSRAGTGKVFDRFTDRITFPIKNYGGQIVGFTARVIDSNAKAAKYINTSETPIYSKSKVVFGLDAAKQEIRKQDCAVVVEGNMDVIACHQAGFKNVVGSSGTAFTFDQLQTLSRLTKNLKFAFDTDQAGLIATRRALDLSLQLGFNVYVVKIVGAKDPDELLKKDPEAFRRALEEAPLYLDFFFEKAFENYDPNSIQNKKQIVVQLLPLIQKLADPLEVSHYVRILAQRLGTSEKTIYEILAKNKPKLNKSAGGVSATTALKSSQASVRSAGSSAQPAPLITGHIQQLQQYILGFALFNEQYRKEILMQVRPEELSDLKIRSIYEQICKIPENQGTQDKIEQFIVDLGSEPKELAKMSLFMVESEYSEASQPKAFEKEFAKKIREWKNSSAKIQMNALIAEMVLAEQKKDKQKLNQLNQKFLEISKHLKAE